LIWIGIKTYGCVFNGCRNLIGWADIAAQQTEAAQLATVRNQHLSSIDHVEGRKKHGATFQS